MPEKLHERTKKNLLDLQYNKYLQYFNTSIILLFTYFIAVSIAFITKQINYKEPQQLFFIFLLSVLFIVIVTNFMIKFREHLKKIHERENYWLK